ncbi:putative short-chain dehydrogenases/reductase [Phyllosticta citrichinensis]|uniref:Short-chain dehydrogenases/reductase n=1 Tax=Phyllosticta citrichinensis TaxID=1130410 RepID=A0ABR1XFL3_9PEZI
MSDSRVFSIDHFTPTLHTQPCSQLLPANNRLSSPFAVVVIGASRGVGAGIAAAYAKAGASLLILAARNTDELASVARSLVADSTTASPKVLTHYCDVASPTSVKSFAAFVRAQLASHDLPKLDACIFNSGYSGQVHLRLTDGDPEDGQWETSFAVNALGTYHAAHYFVPLLRAELMQSTSELKNPGSFVAVGSFASCITTGVIANSKYCISKMAQARIVEHLAEQFGSSQNQEQGNQGPPGMLAVAVHPGAVDTQMARDSCPEDFYKYLTDSPDLCGAFCVWLTKDPDRVMWLNGRLLSATWDPDELLAKRDDVIKGDLLKFVAVTSKQ